jgi:hypothetical protein
MTSTGIKIFEYDEEQQGTTIAPVYVAFRF